MAVETFASTTTWVAPAGVTSVDVECWGGGGGGGQCSSGTCSGGGGAGGAYAKATISVTPGNTYDIIIGAGGSGTTGTKNGGATYFDAGADVYAQGGAGGVNVTTSNGVTGTGSSSSSIGDDV